MFSTYKKKQKSASILQGAGHWDHSTDAANLMLRLAQTLTDIWHRQHSWWLGCGKAAAELRH